MPLCGRLPQLWSGPLRAAEAWLSLGGAGGGEKVLQQTVGFLEVTGLAGAIQAADAAVKAANVQLVGYELSRGYGLVTIKITGDVGAVKVAVEAGTAAVETSGGKVRSQLVIPRPAEALQELVYSQETVPAPKSDPLPPAVAETEPDKQTTEQQELKAGDTAEEEEEAEETAPGETDIEPNPDRDQVVTGPEKLPEDVCNLCGDPLCPRRKGEPRVNCINHKQL